MEDLAVFTALNHSGSFGKNLVKFKKNKYVICRLGGPYGEKLCFKTEVTVFHHTDLPAGK